MGRGHFIIAVALVLAYTVAPVTAAEGHAPREDLLRAYVGLEPRPLFKDLQQAEVMRWTAISSLTNDTLSEANLSRLTQWHELLDTGANIWETNPSSVDKFQNISTQITALATTPMPESDNLANQWAMVVAEIAGKFVTQSLKQFSNRDVTANGIQILEIALTVRPYATPQPQFGAIESMLESERLVYDRDMEQAQSFENAAPPWLDLSYPLAPFTYAANDWHTVRSLRQAKALYDRHGETEPSTRTAAKLSVAEAQLQESKSDALIVGIVAGAVFGGIWGVALRRLYHYHDATQRRHQAAFLLGGEL